MKTRNGFVSNSSSSSFLIIVKEEAFYKAIKDKLDWERTILEQMFSSVQILGMNCLRASYHKSDGYHDWEDFEKEYYQKYKHLNEIDNKMYTPRKIFSEFYTNFFNSICKEDKFTEFENW